MSLSEVNSWLSHITFVSWCEIIGTLFALLGVWLTTRQNIWCWPVSIVAVFIYIYIFYQSQLYGDAGLQIFYLLMSGYGWYEWLYGTKQGAPIIEEHLVENNVQLSVEPLDITSLTIKAFAITSIAGVAGTILLALLLKKTDSNVPWLDASTTAFSLVATWMMARKILENWIYWIIIDAVYVGIYIYKGLYVTGGQYFIFTVLAAYGYWQWKKQLQKG